MMDYTVWGLGTALIGVACLLLGYLLGNAGERHPRNSWAAPRTMEPIEAPEDGTLLEQQIDEIMKQW